MGGSGAAIGAGSGLLAGSLMSTSASGSSMSEVQQRYVQCMYAKGHQVPVSGQFSGVTSQPAAPQRNYYSTATAWFDTTTTTHLFKIKMTAL